MSSYLYSQFYLILPLLIPPHTFSLLILHSFSLIFSPSPHLPSFSILTLTDLTLSLHLCRYPQLTEFWLSSFGKKQIVTVEAFCSALSSYLCDCTYVRYPIRTCTHMHTSSTITSAYRHLDFHWSLLFKPFLIYFLLIIVLIYFLFIN